ncbi:E3 ubiquitin-protein ligase UBR1 [Thelohanellus kitauei]|uniref:E3 ubiquitin-protein ligase n=1 Tax=Thelohanellus kitauei TaxID=669202 RepID=A0A0C2MWW2_THEKT|nr:E3 ubiquitin-protein ligase UBR1 [Thelohanellus kitauei]
MEERKDKIDAIIINGLMVTSNDKRNSVKEIYDKDRLLTLVGVPLKQYLFEGFSPDVKEWFDSDDGKLSKCNNVIFKDDLSSRCIECERHNECRICEDCFLHSDHLNHSYLKLELFFGMNTCDCGELESWKKHSTCSLHKKTDRSEIEAPETFFTKLGFIAKYCCEILEKICTEDHSVLDDEIVKMLSRYTQKMNWKTVKNFDDDQECIDWRETAVSNANKFCLLIQDEGVHEKRNYLECFKIAEEISNQDSDRLNSEMHEHGYICVIYRSDINECQKAKERMDRPGIMIATGVPVKCCIVKVCRLYFMRIATIMTDMIKRFCLKKTKLCDLLSETIFKQTSLADTYVLNEHKLWKDMILKTTNCILLVATYSDKGKAYLANLSLKYIELLYSVFLRGYYEEYVGFLFIFTRIVKFSSVVIYLVEEGFLCKFLELFSSSLKSHGLGVSADVNQRVELGNNATKELEIVLQTRHILLECLKFSLEGFTWSSKFRSEILEAGKKLVQFCFDFDDVWPLPIVCQDERDANSFKYLNLLVEGLFGVVCAVVKWIVFFDEVAIETLKLFLERFVVDIKRISEDNPSIPIKQKIFGYCKIQREKFSILNLSHRVFADILMHCCVNSLFTLENKDQVLCDEVMLMWIGRPMIMSISYITSYVCFEYYDKFSNIGRHFQLYFNGFCHYLYLQDFNLMQILISNLDPDLFVKYILLNSFPFLRENVDFSQPLCSILGSKQINIAFTLQKSLCLIYNALVERHFVGVYDDPEYQLIERQVIHCLACDDLTEDEISDYMLMYREVNISQGARWVDGLKQALDKVSTAQEISENEKIYSLKPSYYNIINIFYFMYDNLRIDREESECYFERTSNFKFELPDIVELRDNFKGMNNFIFSDAFSDLIMYVIVEWYKYSRYNIQTAVDCLLVVCMSLCLLLKISLCQSVTSRLQKTIDLIFGIREDLGETNVIVFLVYLARRIDHKLLTSVIDYLCELSQVPKEYFEEETEPIMNKKACNYRDVAVANLVNRPQDLVKRRKS